MSSKMVEVALPTDPIGLRSFIGKKASILTVDYRIIEGIVYVIDPRHYTIVLADVHLKEFEFIFKHGIKSLSLLSDEIHHEFLTNRQTERDKKAIEARKCRLKKWLNHIQIQVREEDGVLKVDEYVNISSPYTLEDCYCSSVIVLQKIQHVIALMPANFK